MVLKFFMKSSLVLDIKLFFIILLLISCVFIHMQGKKHPYSDILTFTLILYSSHHDTVPVEVPTSLLLKQNSITFLALFLSFHHQNQG